MSERQRVVVVTGGAAGIGAAIAEELGRTGAYVVTLDPVVSVDGSSQAAGEGPNTAQKIVDAGGTARASNTSVTDREAVEQLFAQLVEEFGALDAVVNVAGISRPTDFASGSEEDWAAVLAVHLDGYLNVLGAALPLMEEAGHGPDPRRHLRVGMATGEHRGVRLRQARGRGARPGRSVGRRRRGSPSTRSRRSRPPGW